MFSRTNHYYILTLVTLFSFYLTYEKSLADDLDGAVEEYQRSLIQQETTGSNYVMIFKGGKRIYHKAVESKKPGDKEINDKTVFPIWSMSKPITTVAMMMLHEEGKFDWNDEVSK